MSFRGGGYSTFQNNTATSDGGVLSSVLDLAVTVDTHASVHDNSAILKGGAFYSGSHMQLLAKDSATLESNFANQGGVVYSVGAVELSLIDQAQAAQNSAKQGGLLTQGVAFANAGCHSIC